MVADRVLDVAMAEVVLQRPGVLAVVGEFVAAGVPQHVRVGREWQTGSFTRTSHKLAHVARGHGSLRSVANKYGESGQ